MAKYDGYQPRLEAMVTELKTDWPADVAESVDQSDRARLAAKLHADPAVVTSLRYERQHTGFARCIVVTEEDLSRLAK